MKKNIAKGYTVDSLRIALLQQSYTRTEIDKVIEETHRQLSLEAPKMKEKPVIDYELIDENNNSIKVEPKISFWKRLFG